MNPLLHTTNHQFIQWLGYDDHPLGTDPGLQSLVQLTTQIACVPVAFISLFTDQEQIQLAQVGIEIERVPFHDTFCQFAICQEKELFIVEDARLVPQIQDLSLVQADPKIRFYAGMSIKSKSGEIIGSYGIIDFEPKILTEEVQNQMILIGRHVASYFQQRLDSYQSNLHLQKALESKLSRTEAFRSNQERSYQRLFESITSSHITSTFSIFGKILQVNGHFAEFIGYSIPELVNKPFTDFIPTAEVPSWESFWSDLMSGKTYHGKIKFLHAHGHEVWLYSSFCPTFNEHGQVDRILQISQEITRQVSIEGELRQSKQKADHLNKQKDIFIANLSHEIRTPINAILGYTDILLESEKEEIKAQQLKSIQYAGDNLLHLVNDLLDYSKIEAGLFQFHQEPFKLREVIEHVHSMLKVKAQEKGISIRYHIDESIPEQVMGDSKRLNQILLNLISNGIKFTSQGEVTTTVKVAKESPYTLQFFVKDTGIGIPSHRTEAVFERYHQAASDTSHHYGGTGLGLSICRHLVEKQGGTIWLSSEEGKGTVVSFQIPMTVCQQPCESIDKPSSVETTQARILMCEDNEINIRLAKTLFSKTQYQLDTAPNGQVGIELFLANPYDLILMDIQMPIMDGLEATFKLRNEHLVQIPIIGLSAHALQHEKDNCLNAGMNDYQPKPYKKEELFAKIEFWISKKALTEQNKPHLISLDELNSFTGGDETFQQELLHLMAGQLGPLTTHLAKGIEQKEIDFLSRDLHTIKGSLGVLGVDVSLIVDLEELIRTKRKDPIPLAKRVLIYLEEIQKETFDMLNSYVILP